MEAEHNLIEWVWKHIRQHPPRCLAGVNPCADTAATQAVNAAFPSEGVLWELCPHTPGQRPTLFGHFMSERWPPDYAPFRGLILLSPLTIRWEPSGEEVVVFDGGRHGYNSEYNTGPVHTKGWRSRAMWRNPEGQSADPTFVACFNYTFWTDEFVEGDEMKTRPQDFFEWFTLIEVDRANGRVTPVTNYECA